LHLQAVEHARHTVDARIKSAQDDFRSIAVSPKPVIVVDIISPDSPVLSLE
jgi:hypothetical protein